MYNMRIVRFLRYLALSDIRNDKKATRAKETDNDTLSDAMLFSAEAVCAEPAKKDHQKSIARVSH